MEFVNAFHPKLKKFQKATVLEHTVKSFKIKFYDGTIITVNKNEVKRFN